MWRLLCGQSTCTMRTQMSTRTHMFTCKKNEYERILYFYFYDRFVKHLVLAIVHLVQKIVKHVVHIPVVDENVEIYAHPARRFVQNFLSLFVRQPWAFSINSHVYIDADIFSVIVYVQSNVIVHHVMNHADGNQNADIHVRL